MRELVPRFDMHEPTNTAAARSTPEPPGRVFSGYPHSAPANGVLV